MTLWNHRARANSPILWCWSYNLFLWTFTAGEHRFATFLIDCALFDHFLSIRFVWQCLCCYDKFVHLGAFWVYLLSSKQQFLPSTHSKAWGDHCASHLLLPLCTTVLKVWHLSTWQFALAKNCRQYFLEYWKVFLASGREIGFFRAGSIFLKHSNPCAYQQNHVRSVYYDIELCIVMQVATQ